MLFSSSQLRRTSTALALCALLTTPAAAAPIAKSKSKSTASSSDAEAYAERATERFKAKDFEVAAKLFMQAYARSHVPALVFNAARAYEEAGKPGDAASLFKLYITISDDADGIVNARERIKRLAAKPEDKPPQSREVAQPQPIAGKPSAAKPPAMLEAQAPPSDKPAPPDNTLAWAATGTAAVAVVGGAVLMAVGASNSAAANDLQVRDEAGLKNYGALYDRAELQWKAGIGGFAIGAVLGGWAAWLHLRRPSVATRASWSIDPATRNVQLAVRF